MNDTIICLVSPKASIPNHSKQFQAEAISITHRANSWLGSIIIWLLTMKYYQYLIKGKDYPENEFWICESCRKQNNRFILEGKWRLIGKITQGEADCIECKKKAAADSDINQNDLPNSDSAGVTV